MLGFLFTQKWQQYFQNKADGYIADIVQNFSHFSFNVFL